MSQKQNIFPAIIRVPLAHTLGAVVAGLIFSSCASPLRRPCDFTVKVRVLDAYNTDFECRRLGAKWSDGGKLIKDTDWIRGCSTDGIIISNGSESNLGHEMNHQAEANCK